MLLAGFFVGANLLIQLVYLHCPVQRIVKLHECQRYQVVSRMQICGEAVHFFLVGHLSHYLRYKFRIKRYRRQCIFD